MPVNDQFVWRDGPGCKYIAHSYNAHYIFCGWNDTANFTYNDADPSDPVGGVYSQTTNEILKSTDDCVTWTLLTNRLPFKPRHIFICEEINNKLIIGGGDPYNLPIPQDIWSFDLLSGLEFDDPLGWTQLTADWGTVGGSRIIFSSCLHQGNILMAGGQNNTGDSPTMFTDVVKYNFNTNQFEFYCNLPIGYFSAGAMFSDGFYLYIMGGGKYPSSNLNRALWRYDGSVWQKVDDFPVEFDGPFYCSATYAHGRIFYINGADDTNRAGVWYSRTGKSDSWARVNNSDTTSHARGICLDMVGNICLHTGNLTNEIDLITPITT